jgi:hypothetical protein
MANYCQPPLRFLSGPRLTAPLGLGDRRFVSGDGVGQAASEFLLPCSL